MEFYGQPNLLLEALAYLGRRFTGRTWQQIEQRIQQRKIDPSPSFRQTLAALMALTDRVDAKAAPENDAAQWFGNLEGFPYNTIGSGSIAFLFYYAMLEHYHGDFNALVEEIGKLTPGQLACNFAIALDLTDARAGDSIEESEFLDLILSLSVPDQSKVAILSAYRNSRHCLDETARVLRPVLRALEQEEQALAELTTPASEQIAAIGCEAYLGSISRLEPVSGTSYLLRPFIFGMDTDLTSDLTSGRVCIYCGILRGELLTMLNLQAPLKDEVYEAYRLMGDRTRFDILCYLRGHRAYAQELSSRFGLSRNTIHHHMSKLISSGLVLCAMEGNRVYYTLDTGAVETLLNQQRELFGPTVDDRMPD